MDIPEGFRYDIQAMLERHGCPPAKRTEIEGEGTTIGLTNTVDGPRLGYKTKVWADLLLHLLPLLVLPLLPSPLFFCGIPELYVSRPRHSAHLPTRSQSLAAGDMFPIEVAAAAVGF